MKTRKQLKSEIERLEMALQTADASNDHLMKLVKEKNEEIEHLKSGDCVVDEWCAYCKYSKYVGNRIESNGKLFQCLKKIKCKNYEERNEKERRETW